MKWKGNSRLDWAWYGFDLGVTVHYLDGFHESINANFGIPFNQGIFEHYVKQTWFFDVRGFLQLYFCSGGRNAPVPGYSKDRSFVRRWQIAESAAAQTANFGLPCWKRLLNGTTVTLGCNNVFGHDPPDSASPTNYADFLYDSTGRFVYVSLQKRF